MNTVSDSAAEPVPLTRSEKLRARMRQTVLNMVKGMVPSDSAVAMARTRERIDDAHFEEAVCRNCGTVRSEPHCGACGQKAVARLDSKDVVNEFWQAWRLFEASTVHAVLEMIRAPGLVAREYVLGARKRHMHPLKLLFLAVGVFILLIGKVKYLQSGQVNSLGPIADQIVAWSKWSFSMTLLAIWLASWLTFRRRLGYNVVEHLAFAIYTQFLILVANITNIAPLLALDPEWVAPHRAASRWYMSLVEVGIVALALYQFHRLTPAAVVHSDVPIAIHTRAALRMVLLCIGSPPLDSYPHAKPQHLLTDNFLKCHVRLLRRFA